MSNADTRAFTPDEIYRWFQVSPSSGEGSPSASAVVASCGVLTHVPGDTTTPPAPGAVWIGSGDA